MTDNGKYYLEYALQKGAEDGTRYVWGLRKPKEEPERDRVRYVKYKGAAWFWYHARAKTILYSHHLYNYLPLRKGQNNIFMWHAGGAYKRIGQNVAGNTEKERQLHRYRNTVINHEGNIFLSSSEGFTKYNILETYGFTGRIEQTGMPRNDIFFRPERVTEAAQKVRKAFGIGEEKTVILYAPTFRATKEKSRETRPDLERARAAAREKTGRDAVILYRCHYYEESSVESGGAIHDASEYPDMQELLCCADMLITDYSSCIWDYSFLGRPCFLYVPDLEEYTEKEQGLFTPIETWPGRVCRNMDELDRAIRDDTDFQQMDEAHHRLMGSYEDGKACERLYQLMEELKVG